MAGIRSMKYLFVGDPHAKPEDLDDCRVLMDFVFEQAAKRDVDKIVLLGDIFHTFSVIRLEILTFWNEYFKKSKAPIIALVGNHDMSPDSSSVAHSLEVYKSIPGITVVDEPMVIDGLLFVPYIAEADEFVAICNEYSHCNTAVVHQEFNNAQYENGFFAKNGVMPDNIPQLEVISGHIHMAQVMGRVNYLGSPRWLTASDANQDRFIYEITEHVGVVTRNVAIPSPCQRIFQVEDHFEKPYDVEIDPRHRYIVDITGPLDWIEARRPKWTGKARIRPHRTDQATVKLKESLGIEKALMLFADGFVAPQGTPKEVLLDMVHTRLMT